MHPSKAPGEDGLTPLYFQHYWNLIGSDVCNAISHFFKEGRMLRNINHTVISLIPKVKEVITMKDLSPIGLCNVLYKIIAKVFANRLRPHMDSIISEEQNAFVMNRLIFDKILISHKMIHSLKLRKRGEGLWDGGKARCQ